MGKIQYCDAQAKKLKEEIFEFMENNLFAVVRLENEMIIYYNGLRISKTRCIYSIKDTNNYHEIENLFLLNLILTHMHNAIKSKEVTETAEYNRSLG